MEAALERRLQFLKMTVHIFNVDTGPLLRCSFTSCCISFQHLPPRLQNHLIPPPFQRTLSFILRRTPRITTRSSTCVYPFPLIRAIYPILQFIPRYQIWVYLLLS